MARKYKKWVSFEKNIAHKEKAVNNQKEKTGIFWAYKEERCLVEFNTCRAFKGKRNRCTLVEKLE